MTELSVPVDPIEATRQPMIDNPKSTFMRRHMELIKLTSATLVPLMIAVFTVVTTVQQLASDRDARLTDLRISDQQRDKDLYLAEELRRQVVFDGFMSDMGVLIDQKENLSQSQLTLAVARTRTAFAQLDGARKGHLLEFLYQGGFIRQDRPGKCVPLAGVNLDNTVFQPRSGVFDLSRASFSRASLRNASFNRAILYKVAFDFCELTGALFKHAFLTSTFFVYAVLHHADFTHATGILTTFVGADMTGAIIDDSVLFAYENLVENVIFPNGTHQATIHPSNLIRNAGAEEDPCLASEPTDHISEWLLFYDNTIVTVPYGSSRSPFGILMDTDAHGVCYFWAPGLESKINVITMQQRAILLTDFMHLIDANRALCRISAWLGGVGTRQDYAEVRLLFLKLGAVLKTMELGRTNQFWFEHEYYLSL